MSILHSSEIHQVERIDANLKHYETDGECLEFWVLRITVIADGGSVVVRLFSEDKSALSLESLAESEVTA